MTSKFEIRKTLQEIGVKSLSDSTDADRQAHEDSREYREKIGAFSLKEERFRKQLENDFGMDSIESSAIVELFKNGTIKYSIYLGYPDIIRDKLQIIRQKNIQTSENHDT